MRELLVFSTLGSLLALFVGCEKMPDPMERGIPAVKNQVRLPLPRHEET